MIWIVFLSYNKNINFFQVDVRYTGSLNLWKTEGANARLSFARAGKALAISGANNSVQVIAGQPLLQWTEEESSDVADNF